MGAMALAGVALPTPTPAVEVSAAFRAGVGQGDFEFFLDAAGVRRAGSGHVVTRVLLQVPLKALLEPQGEPRAEVRVIAVAYAANAALASGPAAVDTSLSEPRRADATAREFVDRFEGAEAAARTELRESIEVASVEALRDTDARVLEVAVELRPGDYVIDVTLENLSRLKRGLLDRLRKIPTQSRARMLVRIPDLELPLALGDMTFRMGHGERRDYPARLYGLLNDSLTVAATLYGSGPCDVAAQIHDRDGRLRWSDSLHVVLQEAQQITIDTDVNTLPAGQYVLTLHATQPERSSVQRRSFDVAWSLASWNQSRRDLTLEADVVLTDDEYATFSELSVGEQERFMEDFWKRQDPSPDTALNEVLEEFNRRVAYADIHYAESRRGALSDRGRVYIRLGPPNEIQEEAVPNHLAGTGSEDLIEKVDDPYAPSDHEIPLSSDDDRHASSRAASAFEHSRVIGVSGEIVSYELWIYAGHGSPLLPVDGAVGIDTGLRLLFVDTTGVGSFRLRDTSAKLGIRGLGATD